MFRWVQRKQHLSVVSQILAASAEMPSAIEGQLRYDIDDFEFHRRDEMPGVDLGIDRVRLNSVLAASVKHRAPHVADGFYDIAYLVRAADSLELIVCIRMLDGYVAGFDFRTSGGAPYPRLVSGFKLARVEWDARLRGETSYESLESPFQLWLRQNLDQSPDGDPAFEATTLGFPASYEELHRLYGAVELDSVRVSPYLNFDAPLAWEGETLLVVGIDAGETVYALLEGKDEVCSFDPAGGELTRLGQSFEVWIRGLVENSAESR